MYFMYIYVYTCVHEYVYIRKHTCICRYIRNYISVLFVQQVSKMVWAASASFEVYAQGAIFVDGDEPAAEAGSRDCLSEGPHCP